MLVNKYILKATVDSRDLKPLGFELSNLKEFQILELIVIMNIKYPTMNL